LVACEVNGVAIVIDSYLDEKVYTVDGQVRQLACYGVHCSLLDGSQLSRKHLFERLVRGSYTWPQESEADENVYTANLNLNLNLFCYIAWVHRR